MPANVTIQNAVRFKECKSCLQMYSMPTSVIPAFPLCT